LRNNNTQVYAIILKSYLFPKDLQKWFDLLKGVPRTAIMNFFFSNFFCLPCFFVCVVLINLLVKHNRLTRPELIVMGNMALVFLFNNLAPAYEGWQMRGEWMARLYQPIFIVLFMYSVRSYQAIMRKSTNMALKWSVYGVFMLTLIGNGIVIFGPLLNNPFRLSSQVYWRFYQHSGPDSMQINLERYGRRPSGFCRK
ncbi:hypothetical protein JXO59_07660, partial [candidate division KSB1 bacterium]|nr:hypothetical protein [candidate division KSB1 bacterium]